jgi:hypothetical protein
MNQCHARNSSIRVSKAAVSSHKVLKMLTTKRAAQISGVLLSKECDQNARMPMCRLQIVDYPNAIPDLKILP